MRSAAIGLSVILLAGAAVPPTQAGEVPLTIGPTYVTVPVTSFKMTKFKTIYLQQYDFSCGSAALASLLTFHYRRPTSEQQVFQAMFKAGDQQKIRREGFSLLDMKTYLASIDMASDGFEVSLDKLAEIRLPAITLIETNGYKHFVIIKGVRDDRVLIGDPARGSYTQAREDFEARWDKIAFIVRSDVEVAQETFNLEKDWAAQPKAPISTAFRQQGLGSFMLHLPSPF